MKLFLLNNYFCILMDHGQNSQMGDILLFLKNSFEFTELENWVGKVIGTNLPQGGIVSTGDDLIFIIGSTNND